MAVPNYSLKRDRCDSLRYSDTPCGSGRLAQALGVMEYIDVQWAQRDSAYPMRLVSELDELRYELRKLEFFTNGNVGFASAHGNRYGTELGEAAVPPLAEINAEQFVGVAIEAHTFEALWRQHVRNAT